MSDKNLRNSLIKLAYEKPELREDLLPLLKEASSEEQVIQKALSDVMFNVKSVKCNARSGGGTCLVELDNGAKVNLVLQDAPDGIAELKYAELVYHPDFNMAPDLSYGRYFGSGHLGRDVASVFKNNRALLEEGII